MGWKICNIHPGYGFAIMLILVTGGSGFIARKLIPKLLSLKHEIAIFDICSSQIKSLSWFGRVQFYKVDIACNEVDDIIENIRPNILIHLAWANLPNYQNAIHIKNNLSSHITFLNKIIESGTKKIIVSGTCLEYGLINGCISEHMMPKPVTYYGFAKNQIRLALDFLQTKHKFTYHWFRIFYVYGEDQNPKSLYPSLINAIKNNKKYFKMSSGEQIRDFIHIDDVIKYFYLAVKNDVINGAINLSSGKGQKVIEFVNEIILKHNSNIIVDNTCYKTPDYEPFEFWGCNKKLLEITE